MDWKLIHGRAVEIITRFKRSELEVIGILQEVDANRVYEHFGLTSTFRYCVSILKLTDDKAYSYIRVARIAVEVPAIKTAIAEGDLGVSQAKRIAAVITPENQEKWIENAKNLPQRELDKELAKERPALLVKERLKPVAKDLSELRCSISTETELLLKRAQDLLSQKQSRSVSLSEVVHYLAHDFVKRQDPIEKAKRALLKPERQPLKSASRGANSKTKCAPENGTNGRATFKSQAATSNNKSGALVLKPVYANGRRTAIPRRFFHEVMDRTQGQCTATDAKGVRCTTRRWVNLHHLQKVSRGGVHASGNLTLLCSTHHRLLHKNERRTGGG